MLSASLTLQTSGKPNLDRLVRFCTSLVSETNTGMGQMSAEIVTATIDDRAVQVTNGMGWSGPLVPRS
jgi:hypothetical protein